MNLLLLTSRIIQVFTAGQGKEERLRGYKGDVSVG